MVELLAQMESQVEAKLDEPKKLIMTSLKRGMNMRLKKKERKAFNLFICSMKKTHH